MAIFLLSTVVLGFISCGQLKGFNILDPLLLVLYNTNNVFTYELYKKYGWVYF